MLPVKLDMQSDRVVLSNGLVRLTLDHHYRRQSLACMVDGQPVELASAPFLLLQRRGGYGGLDELAGQRVDVLFHDTAAAAVRVSGETARCTFSVSFALRAGDRHVQAGRVSSRRSTRSAGSATRSRPMPPTTTGAIRGWRASDCACPR
jgi:hypothetical protein